MKNSFYQKINFFITAALLLMCTVIFAGCDRTDILELMEDSSAFGDGSDGDITITGTVNIISLYEDDNVAGVITDRGTNKGLNHGAGEYYPRNRKFIMARNFTINSGASLTVTQWNGADSRLGVVWIACTATFTNNGTINLKGRGGAGGNGGADETTSGYNYKKAGDGIGPGGGEGAGLYIGNTGQPGDDKTELAMGRNSYGTADITLSTWNNIYGSGGGGGSGIWIDNPLSWYGLGGSGGSNAEATSNGGGPSLGSTDITADDDGAAGGSGGGALRIYAVNFVNTGTGIISCNGNNGNNATLGGGDGGGGGGGSGGTIYIETTECNNTGTITCTGGAGGSGGASGLTGDGSAGSVGRIAIKSPVITSTTTDPVYYNILQGSY